MDAGAAALLGASIGSITTIIATVLASRLQNGRDNTIAEKRRTLLRQMLSDKRHRWRKLDTLSKVIGADHTETTRLLIELGARGNTGEVDGWALVKDQPLPTSEER
jgi:hypothetical protein